MFQLGIKRMVTRAAAASAAVAAAEYYAEPDSDLISHIKATARARAAGERK